MQRFTTLTIAGSDCSGGAGVQADLKTMMVCGVYGMSIITALTAQNTTGISQVMEVTPAFLAAQLDAVFTDITPDAVKIGMVPSAALLQVISEKLEQYHAKNIVLDPVMAATSGRKLLAADAYATLCSKLIPMATLLTPNVPEAEVLCGKPIATEEDMEFAAAHIWRKYGCNVLLKGGHLTTEDRALDLLKTQTGCRWFCSKRIENPNTHGTGCTLSTAIAAGLAKGERLEAAVEQAKAYLDGAIATMLDLGKGNGPLDHGYCIKPYGLVKE